MSEMQRGWDSAPAPVVLAAIVGFGKAGIEGLLGVIGIWAHDEVGDSFAWIVLVYAAVFAIASLLLLRGSRLALGVTVVLTGVAAAVSLVYVFVGPNSAIIPCLVTLALNAAVLFLLLWPQSARAYFGRA